jgi:ABC-type branched-subunit amino acid transport system substrate-binding protein
MEGSPDMSTPLEIPTLVRRGGAALAALGMLAVGYSADAEAAEPDAETIKIGAIAPLEGPAAGLGESFLQAVTVSVDTLGTTENRYELVVADGGTTEAETEQAARDLIDQGVDAVVGAISATGQVVQPIATEAQVPYICVCSIPTIGDGVYSFTNIPLAEDEANVWVAEAQRRGIERIAIFAQNNPSIDRHVALLKDQAQSAGMTIVYENRFDAGTTEFRSAIIEAVDAAPDVYFVEGYEPSLSALGTQLNAVEQTRPGTEIRVASIVALAASQDRSIFEGAWYTDSALANDDVLDQFDAAYPDAQFVTHTMAYGYDSVRMIVDAFESGQDPVEYLRNLTEYDGSAVPITRDPTTGNFRSEPVVWEIRDGQPQIAIDNDTPTTQPPASGPDSPSTDPGPHGG